MTPFEIATIVTAFILILIIIFLGDYIFKLLDKIDYLEEENKDLIFENSAMQNKLSKFNIEV